MRIVITVLLTVVVVIFLVQNIGAAEPNYLALVCVAPVRPARCNR